MALTPLSRIPRFDPRHAPVVGVDSHLPAVPVERLQPQALRMRFRQPPSWQPDIEREWRYSDRSPATAAVLVPIVQREQPTVLLTLRPEHMNTHSGQVAFPGGRVDESDASVTDAALREAYEEVGLQPHLAEVIGTLPAYVTGTAFHITPVVALVSPDLHVQPNPDEVADVFEVPLAFLMNPAHHMRHALEHEGVRREWFSMPYSPRPGTALSEREYFIWGATAGMLRNFYKFLVA